jgi:hypothetical protein
MFLLSILKSNARKQGRTTRQRQFRFECLEGRRFCAGTVGLAFTTPMPLIQVAAIQSPANAVANARQLVQLNPQPEPPLPTLVKL